MQLKHFDRIVNKINLMEFWYAFLLASLPLPFNFQNIIFIGFILAIIYNFFSSSSKTSKYRIYHLFCYLIYLLIITSIIWSSNIPLSVDKGILRFLNFILIPSIFLIWNRSKVSKYRILVIFSFFVTCWAVFFITCGIFYWLIHHSIDKLFHHELVSVLGLNRIYVSAMVFISVLHLIINIKFLSKYRQLFLVIQVLFLFLLSSKLFIALSIMAISIVYVIRIKKVIKVAMIIGILLISFMTINSLNRGKLLTELNPNLEQTLYSDTFGQLYYANGINLRMLYIRFYCELVKEERVNFFLGSGIGTSQIILNQKIDEYDIWRGYKQFNYHNQYIQGLAEMGLLYPVFLCFLLIIGFRKLVLQKNYFGVGVIFMFIILFFSESFLYRQKGIYLFLLIYFLLIDDNFNVKRTLNKGVSTK
ncbi:hypothetical protein Q4Q35_06675 [Flavivirga aquimarina]|uniref:O-antigen ligase domain-containing protein n=1 Tax=Flavivirga aquimarina TaxID=2027862 RepID=A0ABT8W8M8_9FLAO|nr:hypothetical protein [Flavivirga aquimarina]MDO5969484.1 hypothetical protein [Flavivirga aquimarina]